MESSFAYLLAPAIGYVVAQSAKYFLGLTAGKGWKEVLFRSGGMPSGHTTSVMALLSVMFFNEGITTLFAVAVVFATLFIYDAMVARRSIGEQGVSLTKLLEEAKIAKDQMPRVALGHTPLEVLVGGLLGTGVGAIVAIFITI